MLKHFSFIDLHHFHYFQQVESALFCDVLKHADENGLIDIDA